MLAKYKDLLGGEEDSRSRSMEELSGGGEEEQGASASAEPQQEASAPWRDLPAQGRDGARVRQPQAGRVLPG